MYDAMNKRISIATGDEVGILNAVNFFSAADVIESIAENLKF